MNRSRTLAAAALLLGAASVGWLSCSGKQSGGAAGDAATETGASSGAGGSGGSGGATSGGTGGSGGGLDAGEWGAWPDWEPTKLVAAGCAIERLANAPQVRFFKWKPCSWSPNDCEQAEFNPDLVGTSPDFVGRVSSVDDDGVNVRIGLAFHTDPVYSALFAREDGMGLVGIRPSSSTTTCDVGGASVRGARFGVEIWRQIAASSSEHGGLVGALSGPSTSQKAFTLTQANPYGIAQGYRLGATRWLWEWADYGFSTVSATDGSGYKMFAKMVPPSSIVYLGWPVTTGKTFLFDAVVGDDAGAAHSKIFYSDGIAAPQVYLEPTEPDTYYGSPIYANSYVAFFKGIGFQDVNKYNSVELWASPYAEDPSQLKPVKLADMPYTSMPAEPAGGWGFAALGGPSQDKVVWIWDLAAGTDKAYGLPVDYKLDAFPGVSRQHVWVSAARPGGQRPYLMRFRLP